MTTAKLKDYYLAFWLKQETAETRAARLIWGLWTFLVPAVLLIAAFLIPVILVEFLVVEDATVRVTLVLLSMCFGVLVFMWLTFRPLQWRREREIKHTAELSDGQVVTLNLKTANGVDYADKALGDFLHKRLTESVGEWEGGSSI